MYELTILVPVYNEVQTIGAVLARLENLRGINYEVIVVDDASIDGSREWLQRWQSQPGHLQMRTRVIFHKINRGKGGTIKSGLTVARSQFFVVHDADLEYDPADLPALMTATKNARVVYGSRFLGTMTGMPILNAIANRGYNLLLHLLYGRRITDMHTCYKLIDTSLFRSLNLQSERFDYAAEIISKLFWKGEPIIEVPIRFQGRTPREGKKIGLRDGWQCLLDIVRYRFRPPL